VYILLNEAEFDVKNFAARGRTLSTEVAKIFQDRNNSSHHTNAEFNNIVFYWNISKFLTTLPAMRRLTSKRLLSLSTRFQDLDGPQKVGDIHRDIFSVYSCISSVQFYWEIRLFLFFDSRELFRRLPVENSWAATPLPGNEVTVAYIFQIWSAPAGYTPWPSMANLPSHCPKFLFPVLLCRGVMTISVNWKANERLWSRKVNWFLTGQFGIMCQRLFMVFSHFTVNLAKP